MDEINAIDRDALTRALAAARAENEGRRRQIDSMLSRETWQRVALFACSCVQSSALDLPPWQMPPSCINLDSALRQPFGDARGAREGGEILKKLLALGLSKYEPDPLRAIERRSSDSVTGFTA